MERQTQYGVSYEVMPAINLYIGLVSWELPRTGCTACKAWQPQLCCLFLVYKPYIVGHTCALLGWGATCIHFSYQNLKINGPQLKDMLVRYMS